MTAEERRYKLFQVLHSYANTVEQHASVAKMYPMASELDYIIALADGLKYGNWPWIIHTKPSLHKGCEE
jgi:hypothetical protein